MQRHTFIYHSYQKKTPAVQKEMKAAIEEWEVRAEIIFAGLYNLECLV